jgi:YVTN family beta-propeller protein
MEKNKNLYLITLISVILILFSVSSIASATTEKCTPSKAQYVYVTNMGDINHPGGTVSVINTAINKVTATVKVGSSPNGIVVTPDGKKVFVANEDNTISIVDATKNKVIKTILLINSDGVPFSGAVSPDGKKVYFLDGDQSGKHVLVIDTTKNKLIESLYLPTNEAGEITISPDGKTLYATVINSEYVEVLDLTTCNVTATISVGSQPDGIIVSPDGKKAYVANSVDNTISVINTAKNTVITHISTPLLDKT